MNATRSPLSLSGVLVPLATPFRSDGSLALDVVPALVGHLLNAGVTGVVVAGTTGEGYALDDVERAATLEATLSAVAGRVPVLAGVGGTSTSEALVQARLAARCGADGVMVAAPAYCLPTATELAQHVLAVVATAGVPAVLYDYPARTGVSFDVGALDLLAGHELVVGIKEASGDLTRIDMLCTRFGGQLALISGSDTLAMHYFAAGARCWIAGFANVLPAEHVAMCAAAANGDLAAGWAIQQQLAPILANVESGCYNAKVKAGLQLRGIDVGPPRPPMAALGEAESSALRAQMVALGHCT